MHQLTDLPDKQGGARRPLARPREDAPGGNAEPPRGSGDARVVAQSIAWRRPASTGRAYEDLEAARVGAGGGASRFGQFYDRHVLRDRAAGRAAHPDRQAARRAFEAMDAEGVVVAVD